MKELPLYISLVFVLTTVLTIGWFHKAHRSSPTTVMVLLWIALQAFVALSGFYTVTDTVPPRFALLVLPPLLATIVMFNHEKGKRFIDGMDHRTMILIHVVRIPVELVLYALAVHKVVPEVMTFEGTNFDIVSGLTAPLVYYYGFIKKTWGKRILLLWNFVCLALLLNIVITAVLSSPVPFQMLAFDQPNVAVLYFPFIWLPCCIVPIVLFAHLVSIRRLLRE